MILFKKNGLQNESLIQIKNTSIVLNSLFVIHPRSVDRINIGFDFYYY